MNAARLPAWWTESRRLRGEALRARARPARDMVMEGRLVMPTYRRASERVAPFRLSPLYFVPPQLHAFVVQVEEPLFPPRPVHVHVLQPSPTGQVSPAPQSERPEQV
jgi:hypothetical protein